MKMFKTIFLSVFMICMALLSLQSCKKDTYVSAGNVNISASIDTVLFDTVFTSVGSITKRIKIRNHESEKVKLSQVYVENNVGQMFKINVDGQFKSMVTDVDIYPNDSIFIFVEVTVDPNNQANPFIIEDDLVIAANSTEKKVHLVAWGQNANYYYKETADSFLVQNSKTGEIDTLLLSQVRFDQDTTLTNNLPHVFYSNIVVRNNALLKMEAGTRIHLRHNASIYVHDGGQLQINGTGFEDDRVFISGSRLDDDYVHRPGQWGVIRICQDAGESWIKNAKISNGTIGCYVGGPFVGEDFDVNLTPKVTIENSTITNMNQYGLLLQSAETEIGNSEISDCGEVAIFNYIGGTCNIRHSTIANYFSGRSTVSMALSNYVENKDANNQTVTFSKPLNFSMTNSILYGNYQTELVFDQSAGENWNVNFDACLLRVEEGKDIDINDAAVFTNCIFNESPEFIKTYKNRQSNYGLDTLSAAQNKANPSFSGLYPLDLKGESRLSDGSPDIGAFERFD
ncbi:MAG: right-handed parallel beta-helix repeat-containing protein [Flavobacteriales bacterium]